MDVAGLKQIFAALDRSGCRYLVVGGVAVIAHGYIRTTRDLDLVIDLDPPSTRKALQALDDLGYQPRIPVSIFDFANAELRRQWQEEKEMLVFNIFSPRFPKLTIDLFPAHPFSFEEEFAAAVYQTFGNSRVPIVRLDTLIAMKRDANRPNDLVDVQKLETLRDNR